MRPILAALCLVVPAVVSAGEQDERPPREGPREPSPEGYAEGLAKGLNLDAKQADKVKALAKESFERSKAKRAEMKALADKMEGVQKDIMSEMRRLDESVRAELTLEQKELFDTLRVHARHGPPGGPGHQGRGMDERGGRHDGGGEEGQGGERRRDMRFERREGQGGQRGRRMEMEEEDDDEDEGSENFPPEMMRGGRGEGSGGRGERGGERGPQGRPDGD